MEPIPLIAGGDEWGVGPNYALRCCKGAFFDIVTGVGPLFAAAAPLDADFGREGRKPFDRFEPCAVMGCCCNVTISAVAGESPAQR